jgi:thioredoxin-related protein
MQKVKSIFLVLFIGAFVCSFSIPAKKEKINWISLAELNELYYKQPKPILVDVYTDWCGWCKVMDAKTYTNEKLAAYINEHYYAVKYNAESADTVLFNKKRFVFNEEYKSNELALFLTSGRLEFPTTVFLSSIDAQPALLSGYLKPKEMEAPLKFFGEGAHTKQTFVAFEKSLKKEWK